MTLIKDKNRLNDINAYLLILFSFVLPISVAGGNFIALCIFIIWLLRGTFRHDWQELKDNKVVLAVLVFYALHIVGLLWTEDLQWGLHILKKETKFLLIPIFMLFIRYEHIKYYIYAFLLAMSISEMLSYGVWFEIIPEFKNATVANPTPFMSHISYNPLLTFAIYLMLANILFNKEIKYKQKVIYSFFIITMSINMFITGGRAGQIMYFVMLVLLLFQFLNKQRLKAFLLSVTIVTFIFILSYKSCDIFYERVNEAIYELKNYENHPKSSVGARITFTLNSVDIIKENLFKGVGTGDFKNEYKKINQINSPKGFNTDNPHNMYILELVQFGLLGIISLLAILYFQVKFALENNNLIFKYIGITMPLLYSVIMLSDSYLLGHYTSMLFIFFSAFLYKDFRTIQNK